MLERASILNAPIVLIILSIIIGHSVPPRPLPVMPILVARARRRVNQCDGAATAGVKMSDVPKPRRSPCASMNW